MDNIDEITSDHEDLVRNFEELDLEEEVESLEGLLAEFTIRTPFYWSSKFEKGGEGRKNTKRSWENRTEGIKTNNTPTLKNNKLPFLNMEFVKRLESAKHEGFGALNDKNEALIKPKDGAKLFNSSKSLSFNF